MASISTCDWPGPLAVSRLGIESVHAAVAAAHTFAVARGCATQLTTTAPLVAASFECFDHLRVDGRTPNAWAPLSGFVRAADGWVRLHANYPHHLRGLQTALGVRSRSELEHVASGLGKQDVEDTVIAHGGIATVVRTPDEWDVHPQAVATSGDPWISVTRGGPGRRHAVTDGSPFAGVRVLDVTRVIAGPIAAQLFACLGADVLRIEPPSSPELLDQYLATSMGKRSTELDFGTDPSTLRHLLGQADVVLLGYRPGVLDRFGLNPDALAVDFPHLVVGVLSAWGDHGPWGDRAGFDSIVQAATGIAHLYRSPDGHPGALAVQALDHATGYQLAAHVMQLLADQQAGTVRVSLLGAARSLMAMPLDPSAPSLTGTTPTTTISSPHGTLEVVPSPVRVDGAYVTAPVSQYGRARPTFVTADETNSAGGQPGSHR